MESRKFQAKVEQLAQVQIEMEEGSGEGRLSKKNGKLAKVS